MTEKPCCQLCGQVINHPDEAIPCEFGQVHHECARDQ